MTDGRINPRERVAALDALDALAWQLNAAGTWLGEGGAETESDMLEQAARSVAAACWLLSRPIRPQPGPEKWQQPVYGTDLSGQPYRH